MTNSVTPDGFEYNGKRYNFSNSGSFPFFITSDGRLLWGLEQQTHHSALRYLTAKQMGIDPNDYLDGEQRELFDDELYKMQQQIDVEGRLYTQVPAITYWDGFWRDNGKDLTISEVKYIVNTVVNDQHLDKNILKVQVNDKLVSYWELFKNDIKINKESNEKLRQMRVIHLMNQDDKRKAMGGYLKDRSQNNGKKLSFSNGKGEMTQAEWNSLHRIGDSKEYSNKKQIRETVKLSLSDIGYIVENVIKRIKREIV